jgi:hypothetical protein
MSKIKTTTLQTIPYRIPAVQPIFTPGQKKERPRAPLPFPPSPRRPLPRHPLSGSVPVSAVAALGERGPGVVAAKPFRGPLAPCPVYPEAVEGSLSKGLP